MRHPRVKKVLLIALGVGSLFVALAVLMFPRFVRGVVDDLERRRGIRITYQSMRPSLGGITFRQAEVSAGSEVHAHAQSISVHVDWWSRRPTRIVVNNAATRLVGTPEAVRTRVRGPDGGAGSGAAEGRRLSVELLDGTLSWVDLSPTTRSLSGEGVTALLGDAGLTLRARSLTVEDRDGLVRISDVHGSAPSGGDEVSLTSKELWLQVAPAAADKGGGARPGAASRGEGPLAAVDRAWAEGQRAVTKLVDKLGVTERRLSWTSEVVTLETAGTRAPVRFERMVAKLRADADAVELSAEASAQGSTPVSRVSVKVPRTRGLTRATFELHELDAFAMIPASKLPAIEGLASLRLWTEGTLSYSSTDDVSLSLRVVATQGKVRIARVAAEAFSVAGLGADVDVARTGGSLAVQKVWLRAGEVRVKLSGLTDLSTIPDSIRLTYDIPPVACQVLLDAIPKELLSQVSGMRASGSFAISGFVQYDEHKPERIEADYNARSDCRYHDIPKDLRKERFKRDFTHKIYLPDGNTALETTGPGTARWVAHDEIGRFMRVAILTNEDGGFYKHHGFAHRHIKAAIVENLRKKRFVRGASTVTMQLAKNLFLARDKTLARKLEELILTDYLEQAFSKDELMELYLNVIEFGPNVYGIGQATRHYFRSHPATVSLPQAMYLASLLPNPLRPRAYYGMGEGGAKYFKHLVETARKNGLVTDEEAEQAADEIDERAGIAKPDEGGPDDRRPEDGPRRPGRVTKRDGGGDSPRGE